MATTRKLHFSTHAELKNIIGQDLINDDNIAVIELVKNSIDAGAKRIALTFTNSALPGTSLSGPAILIEDDGSGMSESDVKNKWLNIAYSEKKSIQVKGRELAGNKGVGRFACDRLGSKLDMFTQAKGEELLHVKVDWSAFEGKTKTADTIQKIDVLLNKITHQEAQKFSGKTLKQKGTILAISELRQEWDRDRLLQLKRNLQRFINPIAAFDKGSVEITLDAPHQIDQDSKHEPYERINGSVENQVFEKLKFKTTYIQSEIDADGVQVSTELFHEGERVYRLVESRTDFAPLKGVKLVLHYMNPYKKAYFKRETGLNAVNFGSVFLFVKGYRVPPYGDRGNDWLGLDSRKSQGMTRNIGARELLGHINVHATNLRIVSNREGVVRDKAFAALINRDGYFYSALTRLERFVVDGLDWDSVPEHLRKRLNSGDLPGETDMPQHEVYDESNDRKRRRIALDVLRIVGASPATTKELEINPEILDALLKEREEDVRVIFEKFEAFEPSIIGQDVRMALSKLHAEFSKQKDELNKARQDASRRGHQVERLKNVARNAVGKAASLEKQIKTQQSEILFARVTSSTTQEQLLLLHHQSGLYAQTAVNFIEKTLNQLRQGNVEKATEWAQKAFNSATRVVKVSNFATKANFRLKTSALTADVIQFIKEYLLNVAKDESAQNLKLTITGALNDCFEMRFKPIDLAIVVDNIASNSETAGAKELRFHLVHPSENELRIEVTNDGPPVSPEIEPPDKIFERGVTTTRGSGLGLYHVRETIKDLGGDIQLIDQGRGEFGFVIRLFK